jgi:hypothetical protein
MALLKPETTVIPALSRDPVEAEILYAPYFDYAISARLIKD